MVKIGIIGLGRIGKIHLENCVTKIKGAEVIAAMNPSEKGQEFAKNRGVPLVTSNAKEILENPDIDAVLICSPTDSHSGYVIEAAKRGKAIFCEKPLDLSIDQVKKTLKIVQEANVPLMLAFNQRFDPDFSEVNRQVLSGKIGQIRSMHIVSRDPAPPPISYILSSGGMLMDMTIHDLDMARFQMGCEVTEVFAKGHNLVDPAIGKAGDIDTTFILLTFENNATVLIENSRQAAYGYDQRLEIFGSKGMIRTENPLKNNNIFSGENGGETARNLDFFIDRYQVSYQLELEAFLEAIQKNQPMPVTGKDGLKAMEIAVAANQSINEGKPVRVRVDRSEE